MDAENSSISEPSSEKRGYFKRAINTVNNMSITRKRKQTGKFPANEEDILHSSDKTVRNNYHSDEYSQINDDVSTFNDSVSYLFSEPPLPQSNTMSIVVGVFVAVGGFLFGYDTGLINSLIDMQYVREHLAPNHTFFTNVQMSILVSFLSLGTFVGALSAPIISDSLGRKLTIIISTAFVFSLGNSLQVGATSMQLLVIGRVISGIGIGFISAVVPLYQAETVKKNLRGAIISTYQWAITWGLLVSSAVAQGTHHMDNASSYRIPIGLQYIWSSTLALGMIFLPESPRYHVLKDNLDKAARSLSFLRSVPLHDSGLLEELVEIKATYDYEASVGTSTFMDCFVSSEKRPKQSLRMFTGMALQAFQQFTGINFIFYYGVYFFNNTGVNNSYIISLITYAVNVLFNVPGMYLVEYFGRRKVLIVGGILMTISNFIIAIVGIATNSVIANKVMIAFICVFIATFSATWGGVVWVVSAELYPLGVRAKCTAICAATNWLVNFICAFITPYIVDTVDHTSKIGSRIFFIWGGLNAIGVMIVYLTVYETKGLTLEEIDELYTKSSTSVSSAKWNQMIREKTNNPNNINWFPKFPRPFKNNRTTISTEPDTMNNTTLKNVSTQDSSLNNHAFGVFDVPNNSNYIELGNGLGLATAMHGPPSISTDSSYNVDSEGIHSETNGGSHNEQRNSTMNTDHLNEYISQIVNGSSPPMNGPRTYGEENALNFFEDDDNEELAHNYVELGNGLGITTIHREIPPVLADSSDEDDEDDDDLRGPNLQNKSTLFISRFMHR
ncbi:hypothetical protein KAFR_0L01310 [Kazachstania africana CBS 2517]|uniref:Major facilitator superfamily (MFS) profile domain-containing protein n=1 Tax=Kazachstania africana (strain ATCC 22294 / BCRC 22015 / CBS 2517 / CECT 1963 / NBRC 1671 / NRRL Y-8276) TaxID=1071382 RepID=H2B290_KAZAF|nr:hypothetical protein KAFR_0L01310 [Kazachstania africana CBS 2517]CCF60740.1 hypothetical protein KAFR_0L01310 [Kazachstania africana CBS 2517]